ncbi:MAG: 50S ribosomal protein L17 [Candidatus Muiribacteriaceae bacterium]
MRHRKGYKELGRSKSHTNALLRNLSTSLLEHGKVKTTLTKAKELRRVVEKMITMAGEDNFNTRRRARRYIYKKDVINKLFQDIGPKYKERPGGYTRIYKLGERRGDNAMMSLIELI